MFRFPFSSRQLLPTLNVSMVSSPSVCTAFSPSSSTLSLDKRNEQGFTLMEVVIAVFIVGVMAAVVTPHLLGLGTKAQQTACEENQRMIRSALTQYYLLHHAYPSGDSGQQLQELKDAQLLESIPTDPGSGNYVIAESNDTLTVSCDVHGTLGADSP